MIDLPPVGKTPVCVATRTRADLAVAMLQAAEEALHDTTLHAPTPPDGALLSRDLVLSSDLPTQIETAMPDGIPHDARAIIRFTRKPRSWIISLYFEEHPKPVLNLIEPAPASSSTLVDVYQFLSLVRRLYHRVTNLNYAPTSYNAQLEYLEACCDRSTSSLIGAVLDAANVDFDSWKTSALTLPDVHVTKGEKTSIYRLHHGLAEEWAERASVERRLIEEIGDTLHLAGTRHLLGEPGAAYNAAVLMQDLVSHLPEGENAIVHISQDLD